MPSFYDEPTRTEASCLHCHHGNGFPVAMATVSMLPLKSLFQLNYFQRPIDVSFPFSIYKVQRKPENKHSFFKVSVIII